MKNTEKKNVPLDEPLIEKPSIEELKRRDAACEGEKGREPYDIKAHDQQIEEHLPSSGNYIAVSHFQKSKFSSRASKASSAGHQKRRRGHL